MDDELGNLELAQQPLPDLDSFAEPLKNTLDVVLTDSPIQEVGDVLDLIG